MSLDYVGPPGVPCLIFLQGHHCQDTLLLLFDLPRPSLQIGWFCHPRRQALAPGSGNLSFTSANVSKGSEEESTEALPGMRFHERGPRLKWYGPFLFCALTNEQICRTGSIRLAFYSRSTANAIVFL